MRRLSCVFAGCLLAHSGMMSTISTSAGEIAELHHKWVKPKDVDSAPLIARFQKLENPTHGVTEIGLERTACLGTCPVYTVVIKSDGTVRYTGEEHVARKGVRTGRVSEWSFNHLAEFLVESGYTDLETDYEVPLTDMPTTYTTAVVNGKRKLVRNYGDVGPAKLWVMQHAIDGMLAETEWDDAPPANPSPAANP